MLLDFRPARRRQDNDGKLSALEVLLVAQVLVRRDEDIETIGLGNCEQFTISKRRPALLAGGSNCVVWKMRATGTGVP